MMNSSPPAEPGETATHRVGRRPGPGLCIRFAFRFVVGARPSGWLASGGRTTAGGLYLGWTRVPYDSIKTVSIRPPFLVIGFNEGSFPGGLERYHSDGDYLVLSIEDTDPVHVKRALDGAVSAAVSVTCRECSTDRERDRAFRSTPCPACAAEVELTGLPESRYIYCPYCETIFMNDGAIVTDGTRYRVCEECNLFARTGWYRDFVAYFMVVSNGWSFRRRLLCSRCARRMAWRNALKNVTGGVALPFSIIALAKTFLGHDRRMKGLSRALALVESGRAGESAPLFAAMYENLPFHPGLMYDEAIGLLKSGRQQEALDLLQRSLEECSNFAPSLELFKRIEHVVDGIVTTVGRKTDC